MSIASFCFTGVFLVLVSHSLFYTCYVLRPTGPQHLSVEGVSALRHRICVAQVLRDLGISETRLHNNLVEVWNKADLLPSDPPAADAADRQAQLGLSQQGSDNTPGIDS